jgi:hypothetical protein
MRAVVSKRGVDDGNQKGGGFLQPAQESQYHYSIRDLKVKKKRLFLYLFLCYWLFQGSESMPEAPGEEEY